jgi:transcription elongation GreA/GreB family factor
MDKTPLFNAVREHLQARLTELEKVRDDARHGLKGDDERPDSRGERAAVAAAGALTSGLGQRIEGIRQKLGQLERIDPGPRTRVAPGAVVTVLDEEEGERRVAILPGGEGLTVDLAEGSISVVSPEAPFAKRLSGLSEGDTATVRVGSRAVELAITEIR